MNRRFKMTLAELEKRVQTLEDIEEIKNMHREYIFFLMTRQFEKMVDCFAENAVLDIVTFSIAKGKPTREQREGKKEIRELFKTMASWVRESEGEIPKGGHFLVQPVITVEGNKAKGHWLLERMKEDVKPSGSSWIFLPARYDCEYVKEAGKWKFSMIKLTHPWPDKPSASS
jgi:hypothetical protein